MEEVFFSAWTDFLLADFTISPCEVNAGKIWVEQVRRVNRFGQELVSIELS